MKQLLLSITAVGLSIAASAQTKLYEFNFDNAYTATVGTGEFIANDSTLFTTDRNGVPNAALQIINSGCNATLIGLPYGKSSRSVALWVKINEHSGTLYNMLFKYGSNTLSNAFSGSAGEIVVYIMSYNNNSMVPIATDTGIWNHFVFMFNESDSVAQVYKNGLEILRDTMSDWNTINDNDTFKLGTGPGNEIEWFNGVIDDLHIYDYALSASEVAQLYGLPTSVQTVTNQILNVYPNPANNLLNIETNSTVNIQILNVLGVVITTEKLQIGNNAIDISNFAKGVHLIRSENGSTMKFIKE